MSLNNKLRKSVYNVGYIGFGSYKSTIDGKQTRQYNIWHKIMRRSYSEKLHKEQPSYLGCSVCEEWHNFQNFAKWYDENYYEIDNEIMQIDKDILTKGNKVYSPETCIFVNHHINSLFTKSEGKRTDLPIGVIKYKNGKYESRHLMKKKIIRIGTFETPIEAFNAYKIAKENEIKRVADLYKDKIPKKLHEAMYNYKVDITD